MNYENMTKKELLAEMSKIQKQLSKMQEVVDVKESKELCIKGFTCKDVAVRYGPLHDPDDPNDITYQFYLKKDGKLWDFYYGKSDWGAGNWWPESEDDYSMGPHFEFIPPGFSEACENCYEFRGPLKDAIKRLEHSGITDVKPTEGCPGESNEYAV